MNNFFKQKVSVNEQKLEKTSIFVLKKLFYGEAN